MTAPTPPVGFIVPPEIDQSKLPADFWEKAHQAGLVPGPQHVGPEPLPTTAIPQAFVQAAPLPVTPEPALPSNPYAPRGWKRKITKLMTTELPSGQVVEVRRLERNDLIRLKVLDHMDSLLPLLIDTDNQPNQPELIEAEVRKNPSLIDDVYTVMDVIVMAAVMKPMVTNTASLVNYGTDEQAADPNFVAIVHIDDIDELDKKYIFALAFGRDASDLKSVLGSASGVEPVEPVQGL